jgi:hypothetical protein
MIHDLTDRASRAVERYGAFLNTLRSQADLVFRRGPTNEGLRQEALAVAQDAARAFLNTEHAIINDDTADIARDAYSAAMSDLGLSHDSFAGLDRFGDFIFTASYYVSRILAAQAERDVVAMAQHIQHTALRIDLYVRTRRHTPSTAAAQVMLEDNQAPAFRFVDRMGRKFKASKHIRDIYRLHLLNIYNEVYMDVVADHGHETVFVSHPEPNYKWQGKELAIVSGHEELPLYYDVKDEIFHPSSESTLTIIDPKE